MFETLALVTTHRKNASRISVQNIFLFKGNTPQNKTKQTKENTMKKIPKTSRRRKL